MIEFILGGLFAMLFLFLFEVVTKRNEYSLSGRNSRIPIVTQIGIKTDYIKRIGVFQDQTEPPSWSERLLKSNYCTQVETAGKFGGNKSSYDHVIYKCPKCSELHELEFRHGDVVKCMKCKLTSQTHGNGLTVWE